MKRGRLSLPARLYIGSVAGGAAVAAILLWAASQPAASVTQFVLITMLGIAAHTFPVQARRHQAYQATLPFIVVAAASFNALQLLTFIVAIHVTEQLRVRRLWYIQFFNVCDYFLAAALTAAVYHAALGFLPGGALAQAEGALAAGCTFVLANRLLLAGILWLARSLSPARSGLFRAELLAVDLIITWVSAPMLLVTLVAGPWMSLITAAPLFLARPALAYLLTEAEPPARRAQAPAA